MVGWHHRLNGHEFEQALGVGDEQGRLACCSPWDLKELDIIELNLYCKIIRTVVTLWGMEAETVRRNMGSLRDNGDIF